MFFEGVSRKSSNLVDKRSQMIKDDMEISYIGGGETDMRIVAKAKE